MDNDYKNRWTEDIDRPSLIAMFERDEVLPSAVLLLYFVFNGLYLHGLVSAIGACVLVLAFKRIFPSGMIWIFLYSIFPFIKLGGAPESYKQEFHG